MKKELNNVTLVCIDCVQYGEAIQAIKKSLIQINPKKSLFFTDIKAYSPKFPFEIIKIDKISSKEEYSHFVFKELYKYIETDYVLIIHADGYVLDGNAWDDRFYESDYIGSPWLYIDGRNVGNGVSLRSKKLLEICAKDDFMDITHPEDAMICRLYRPYLEKKYNIRFAPEELADKFGYELREPIQSTFLFHGKFHQPFQPTVVIKRSGALGDCIAAEPLMHYYHEQGYRVVVDMPVHLAMVYVNHYFKVWHISQIDVDRVKPMVIDLDGVYEDKPDQLHLKSYFERASFIQHLNYKNPAIEVSLRNPKLHHPNIEYTKMFKNLCVIHADERDQPYRNIYGVNWREVVQSLIKRGYTVIQTGLAKHEDIEGAIQMHTATNNFLLYLIAGASLFVGIDSGPAAMAVACDVPSVIFFGSVESKYIHPDLSNVCVIEKENPCSTPKCWHNEVGGTTGRPCVVNETMPPCTQFNTEEVLYKIDKFLNR